MSEKQIALLSSGSVFLEGIASYFRARGVDVVVIHTSARDTEQRLQSLKPAVLLVDRSAPRASKLADRILRATSTSVIALDLRENNLDIRTNHHISGATTEQLMAAVHVAVSLVAGTLEGAAQAATDSRHQSPLLVRSEGG